MISDDRFPNNDFISVSPNNIYKPIYIYKIRANSSINYLLLFTSSLLFGVILTFIIQECIVGSICYYYYSNVSLQTAAFKRIGADYDRSPENSDSNLVFVGVMTSQKFLQTRVPAIYNTWGSSISGKMALFASQDAYSAEEDIPIIRLPNTDDSYPPQKKSFLMLKYMYDNYLDHFEFFMRTDDDLYVRPDNLEKFLRSVNSSKPQFIGTMGKGVSAEIGKLSLLNDENFCMGGPGMVMSRETLALIGPHISVCLQNLHSIHEDVEVGRCVRKFARVSCTWSLEMKSVFVHMRKDADIFSSELNRMDLRKVITVHPFKNSSDMYKFHHYLQGVKVKTMETEIVSITRELNDLRHSAGLSMPQLDEPYNGIYLSRLGVVSTSKPATSYHETEVIPFTFTVIQQYNPHHDNPKHRVQDKYKKSVTDVIKDTFSIINSDAYKTEKELKMNSVLYSYFRPFFGTGLQYFMNILMHYERIKGVMQRSMYFQVPYGPLHVRMLDSDYINTQSTKIGKNKISEKIETINFLIPLSGRLEIFHRFMAGYEETVLLPNEPATLTIAHYKMVESGEIVDSTPDEIIKNLKHKYPGAEIDIIEGDGYFNRAPALSLAAEKHSRSSLLFCIDVDMAFNREVLSRIRLHTRLGEQVYFPIVFSQYDPGVPEEERDSNYYNIHEDVGYFRRYGFGIMAAYKGDLEDIGGFNNSITGWGGEDIDLAEKFIKSPKLSIFRTCDDGLIHIHHPPACLNDNKDGDLVFKAKQEEMCLGTIYASLGDKRVLAKRIFDNPAILESDED